MKSLKQRKISLALGAAVSAGAMMAAVTLPTTAASAATQTVTVQPNQSLWKIARAHQTTVAALEASNPGINPQNLLVGSEVKLPLCPYTVKPGDTLWKLAHSFGVPTWALEEANPGVNAANLQVGTVLTVPNGTPDESRSGLPAPVPSTAHTARTEAVVHTATAPRSAVSSTDLYWMARIISAEAQGQPYNAQVAVGDVVWHRVMSPDYPNTVKGVVFDVDSGHYQFSPVANGTIYNPPTASAVQAAQEVLSQHVDLVPGALVFYTPSKTPAASWVRQQPVIQSIGAMTFAK
ncbi:MAG: LysM peptidoglycan-binding domain-containing protein [Alicyclobacillus sp.]|nr:LysM peptidoglycan-binding domain-containing protein [Alicyclobacillus sp.]